MNQITPRTLAHNDLYLCDLLCAINIYGHMWLSCVYAHDVVCCVVTNKGEYHER